MTLRPRGLRARVRVISVLVASSFTACGTSSVRPPQPPFDVVERTIPELQHAMETGQVTSRQLVEQYLARIAAYDQRGPMLNAMISLNEHALDEADGLDRERVRTGPRGPLHGVPIIVKDNYDAVGLSTTAGSIALTEWHPPDDAFQVARLKEAGAVILGKANMHEFAYGVTTVSSLGGQTRNPYDPTRNPGGSSGGTGAAVAANYAAAGMGTDTCGSIRMPSFHHALVGLRGTQGLSSRDGIIPLALTQDMGGPLTKTVTDMAIILDATVGVDPADEVTERSRGHVPESYTTFLTDDGLRGARIGVVDWLLGDAPEDQAVADVIRVALDDLETAGAEVIDIELAEVPDFLQGASLATTEFAPQLADYLRTPGTPVQSLRQILDAGLYHAAVEDRYRRAVAATGLDSPEYLDALGQREPLRRVLRQVFDDERLDAVAYPTLRRTAAHIGEPQRGNNCAISAKSGFPAIVVPAGYAEDGMPVGLELLGPAWSEGELIRLAYSYEQRTRHRRPPVTTPRLSTPPPVSEEWLATGGASVPPVDTAVTARARFTWMSAIGELRYTASVYGVRDADVLFMDLHRGDAGSVGPVEITLPSSSRARASGAVRLTAAQRSVFESGTLYFDVHTRDHPTGVVRAQLDGSP